MKIIKFSTVGLFFVIILSHHLGFAINEADIDGRMDAVSTDLQSILGNIQHLRGTINSAYQEIGSLERENQGLKEELERLKEEHPTVFERAGQWLKENARAPSNHNNYDDRR